MPGNVDLGTPQTVLVNLELDRVALVREGANSRADIKLFKGRKENNSMPKTYEEILAALQNEDATIIKSHVDTLNANHTSAVSKLNGEISTLKTDLEKSKTPPAAAPTEDIFKGLTPEAKAYIETMKGTMASLIADREEALAKARFEDVKHLPGDAEQLKTVLKTVSPAVFEILKAASTAVHEAISKTGTAGAAAGGEMTPPNANGYYDQLAKAAAGIQAVNKSLTFEQAFMDACAQNPDLYKKYASEVK